MPSHILVDDLLQHSILSISVSGPLENINGIVDEPIEQMPIYMTQHLHDTEISPLSYNSGEFKLLGEKYLQDESGQSVCYSFAGDSIVARSINLFSYAHNHMLAEKHCDGENSQRISDSFASDLIPSRISFANIFPDGRIQITSGLLDRKINNVGAVAGKLMEHPYIHGFFVGESVGFSPDEIWPSDSLHAAAVHDWADSTQSNDKAKTGRTEKAPGDEAISLTSNFVGQGMVGDIYEGIWRSHIVAIKFLRCHGTKDSVNRVQKRLDIELKIWNTLEHRNIVSLLGVWTALPYSPTSLPRVITPWMENSSILQYMNRHPEADRLKLILDIVEGLKYLHVNSLVHGDLRIANILVDATGKACITDFGIAKALNMADESSLLSESGNHIRYAAPEVALSTSGDDYTNASDVYSLACIIMEIFSGSSPFIELKTSVSIALALHNQELPYKRTMKAEGINGTSPYDSAFSFLWECFRFVASDRLKLSKLQEHLRKVHSGGTKIKNERHISQSDEPGGYLPLAGDVAKARL